MPETCAELGELSSIQVLIDGSVVIYHLHSIAGFTGIVGQVVKVQMFQGLTVP